MAHNSSKRTAIAVRSVAMLVATASLSAAAQASVTATLTGYPAGLFENVGFSSALSWDSSASVTLYSIRTMQHSFAEASGNQWVSWCAEVYQGVSQGSTYEFSVVNAEDAPGGVVAPGPMGAMKATVVRDLFARWINAGNGMVHGSMADRDAKSAAFQIALWEITHENFTAMTASGMVGQMSLGTGALRASISGATAAWYAEIVASLGAGGFQAASIEGLTSATAQDQIRLVPAPGAVALLAFAGLAGRCRRRR